MSANRNQIKVNFINHTGGGFVENREFPAGTTAGELFYREMGGQADPSKFYIRVNRQEATRNQELQSGDTVSITPVNIKGA